MIERNKDTDKSIGELSSAFSRIKGVAENLALSFLRTFAPAITSVINGVIWLTESLFGLSSISNDALNTFNSQLDSVKKLDQSLSPLADRYDELTAKTKLSKEEQKELGEVTKQLAKEVPAAATAFNEYGEAIGINTDKVRELIVREKELLELEREKAIREQTSNLVEQQKQLKNLNGLLESQNLTGLAARLVELKRQELADQTITTRRAILTTEKELLRLTSLSNIATADFTKTIEEGDKVKNKSTKTTKTLVTEYEKLQKTVQDSTKAIQEQLAKGLTPTADQIQALTQDTQALNKVNDELKDILDVLTPKKVETTTATEEETKATKDLRGEISELNAQQIELSNQKGIAQERIKALKDAKLALAEITGEEDNAAAQVLAIKQNLANELSRINTETLQNQVSFLDTQIQKLEQTQRIELFNFKGTAQEKALLEQQLNTDLAALRLEQVTTSEALLKKDVQNFKLAEDEKTKKAKDANKKRVELATQLIDGFKTILAAFDQLQAAQTKVELDRLSEQQAAREVNIEALQAQLENTTGLERQFLEQQITNEIGAAQEIDNKKAEIAKADNQRKKASAITQAIIGGALGVINAFQLPPPASFIAAAVTAAITAVQIATISAQKFARGGMVEGPSHAQGGVKFNVGGRVNELQGGEAVINTKSTAMYTPLLSAINVAGGGRKFALGGITQSLGAPSISSSTQIGTSVDTAQMLFSAERRTNAIETAIFNQKVTLNTRDTEQDNEDKKVILNTVTA